MTPALPIPGFLDRLRSWLAEKGGLRLELLKYVGGIAGAVAWLSFLLGLALHHAYFDPGMPGLNAWAVIKLLLYLLTGAASIAGLFFCLSNTLRITVIIVVRNAWKLTLIEYT